MTLRLRLGRVVTPRPLTVEVDGERRPAWADPQLVGEVRGGDEVIVNVAALDLGLGSGGFDLIHANLTRGLGAPPAGEAHVMKLSYTSLQHPVEPVETPLGERSSPVRAREPGLAIPVLVIPLHGHLAPAAWAACERRAGSRIGYVQSAGGALPGSLSRDVAELRRRGSLCGHVTAAPAFGGEAEALSVAGALAGGRRRITRSAGGDRGTRPWDPRLANAPRPRGDRRARLGARRPRPGDADARCPAALERRS